MSRIKPAVSLYSLQDEYLNHRMDLADIMRYVKEQGAEGVEILPDQMLKGAPHISDETLNQWNSLLAETLGNRLQKIPVSITSPTYLEFTRFISSINAFVSGMSKAIPAWISRAMATSYASQ